MSAVYGKRSLRFSMNYKEWKEQIKQDKKVRNYQHIDNPLDLDNEKIFGKVISIIEDIKNHQFLPFIKRDKIEVRFRKNKTGKVQRSQKVRPIMYASHIDAHIYSYYNFVFQKIYENYLKKKNIDDVVIAYRKLKEKEIGKGKSNIHFANEVFQYIEKQNDCVVITHDIEGFFNNINHNLLKDKICKISNLEQLDNSFYKVFKSLTKYRYIEYNNFVKNGQKINKNRYAIYKALKDIFQENKTNRGIPQGSPMSGLLANIYLVDFDTQIKESFPSIFYRRYSDDLVFVCSEKQKDILLNFIDDKIRSSLVNIKPSKSFISYFNKDEKNVIFCSKVTNGLGETQGRNYLDYLGLEFNGEKIFLRKNTIQKLKRKQDKKTIKQMGNSKKQKRRKPKKEKKKLQKTRNNYFKRTLEVIDNPGVKRQILKITKNRNKLKSKLSS